LAKKASTAKTTRSRSAKKAASPGSPAVKKKAPAKKAGQKKVTQKASASKKAAKTQVRKAAKKTAGDKKAATKPPSKKKQAARSTAVKKQAAKKQVRKKPAAAVSDPTPPPQAPPTPPADASVEPYVPPRRPDDPLPDEQLRKVKTGLTKKDLAKFWNMLLEHRAELVGDVQGMERARVESDGTISHMPLHPADAGSDAFEIEFNLGLIQSERRMLAEIDEALYRIQNQTYGVCVISGEPIGKARLEARPWSKYSIDTARDRERRGLD
jgi:DnaK suppressor protein